MLHGTDKLLVNVWRRIAQSRWALLSTHVAWTALGICALVPLTGLLGRALLSLSGHALVADQDILFFVLSPMGFSVVIVVATVLVTIVALEVASLMAIGVATGHGFRLDTLAALRFSAQRAWQIAKLALWLLLRVLLIVLPFLAVAGLIYWFALTGHDINFYLSRRPPAFWAAGGAIAAVVLVMAVILVRSLARWSLCLPCLLFAGKPSRQALASSAELTRGHVGRIVVVLALWAAVALALGAIAAGLVSLVGSWIVPPSMSSLRALILVLSGLAALGLLLSVPIAAFNSGGFAYTILALYEAAAGAVPISALPDTQTVQSSRPAGFGGRALVATVVAAAAAVLLVAGWLLRQARVEDKVLVVAHRGAAGAAPENTLASVRRAIDDGADWIEIDVQETSDGEVIVIHDSDFMKLAGVDLKVWDGTFEQARAIDIGSWFDAKYAGERVPTLREVLETSRGRSNVVIELKYYGHSQQLEERVVEIVESTGMVDNIVVMSLDLDGIRKLHALRPKWTTGLLVAKAVGDLTKVDTDFLAVNRGLAKPRFIRSAHRAGKQVYVWTVNDPTTMSGMMSLGVDGIITDEPAMAKSVLAERAQLSTAERLLMRAALLFGRPLPARTYRDDSP